MNILLYLGPLMASGNIAIILIIGGIVALAMGYIIWFRVKQFLNRKK